MTCSCKLPKLLWPAMQVSTFHFSIATYFLFFVSKETTPNRSSNDFEQDRIAENVPLRPEVRAIHRVTVMILSSQSLFIASRGLIGRVICSILTIQDRGKKRSTGALSLDIPKAILISVGVVRILETIHTRRKSPIGNRIPTASIAIFG